MYDIKWVFPVLKNRNFLWNIASTITVAAVGIFSKIVTEWFNTTQVHNRDTLECAINYRSKDVPLITVSNHHSCFDDPGLWGTLSIKTLFNYKKMRWGLAAHDICFTNTFHSYFFMLGKCIPVIRGDGIYQQAVDFCIDRLGKGSWVHIFPEGKVNMTKEFMRLKWGIGRMIYESPVTPLVIPMWHLGMDQILPNEPPYILRIGKKVTVNIGKPIDFKDLVNSLKAKNVSPEEARKTITDKIQEEFLTLKNETEAIHIVNLST